MVKTTRRLGIACLSTALVAAAFSSSQAGIIPWAYDVIFGPNYPMTGGYGVPYSVGYSPCGPVGCSPCSTGTCQPRTSFCGPCEVASKTCEPKVSWDSKKLPTVAEPKHQKSKLQEYPRADDIEVEAPRRSKGPSFPLDETPETEAKKVTTESEATPVVPRATKAGGEAGFVPPTVVPEKTTPTFGTEVDGQASRRPLNLDNKASWTLTSRLPQRAAQTVQPSRFNDARIARQPVDPKVDNTGATSTTTIVKK